MKAKGNKSGIGKWMKNMAVAGLLIMAVFAVATPVEARIGPIGAQYDRQAMIEEARFAVTGTPYTIPIGKVMGKWNYMAYDIPAQTEIIKRITSANAGWSTPVINGNVPYGWYNDPTYGYVGHGGQCLFFVNLLLYRSEADRRWVSQGVNHASWGYIEARWALIDNIRPKSGDVIFRPQPGRHIAVVTNRNGDTVDITESNYFSGNPYAQFGKGEMISHRSTTISALKTAGYRVYTGVSYYNN